MSGTEITENTRSLLGDLIKWEVSSLVTLLFSVNDRILREICESQTSVISVLDLPLVDRAIYRARVLKLTKHAR